MQIKVKDTRMHKVLNKDNEGKLRFVNHSSYKQVPVAEGKLVLVECDSSKEANFWIKLNEKFLKPILISETEKIEVGDIDYHPDLKELNKLELAGSDVNNLGWLKVLVLPEHFSPKHLQAIVDGKMKDGDKVLVECEYYNSGWSKDHGGNIAITAKRIKLNSSNHVTMYKVDEKLYTKVELEENIVNFVEFMFSKNSSYNNIEQLRHKVNNWLNEKDRNL